MQCHGITKAKCRCTKSVAIPHIYCHIHIPKDDPSHELDLVCQNPDISFCELVHQTSILEIIISKHTFGVISSLNKDLRDFLATKNFNFLYDEFPNEPGVTLQMRNIPSNYRPQYRGANVRLDDSYFANCRLKLHKRKLNSINDIPCISGNSSKEDEDLKANAWCKDNYYHRDGAPAVIVEKNMKKCRTIITESHWFFEGFRHREDGPAIDIHKFGINVEYETQRWFLNGEEHRTDGPSYTHITNSKSVQAQTKHVIEEWRQCGSFCRSDGPCRLEYKIINGTKLILSEKWAPTTKTNQRSSQLKTIPKNMDASIVGIGNDYNQFPLVTDTKIKFVERYTNKSSALIVPENRVEEVKNIIAAFTRNSLRNLRQGLKGWIIKYEQRNKFIEFINQRSLDVVIVQYLF